MKPDCKYCRYYVFTPTLASQHEPVWHCRCGFSPHIGVLDTFEPPLPYSCVEEAAMIHPVSFPKTDLFHRLAYRDESGYQAISDLTGEHPCISIYSPTGEYIGGTNASGKAGQMGNIRAIVNWHKKYRRTEILNDIKRIYKHYEL